MREYIVNLTNNLIGKHGFDDLARRLCKVDLLRHIKYCLEADDVAMMNPETMGRIMSSLEIGDLMTSKQELFSFLRFNGNGADLFRELVATCLAHAICIRFYSEEAEGYGVPAYRRGKEGR